MSATKTLYKIVRSILFTVILATVGLFAALYVLLSLPAVQNRIRLDAENELTRLLGGKVTISDVNIIPFNELRLNGVSIYSPDGERCISVGTLGAGVSLSALFAKGDVEITYAEIISLNAAIKQDSPDSALNIQFLIDALKPKDNGPKNTLKFVLHNIVLRKSNVTFDKTWIPDNPGESRFDPNHIGIYNLSADLRIPRIENGEVDLELRRLAFLERSGIDVENLCFNLGVAPDNLSLSDFKLKVGGTVVTISDQKVALGDYKSMKDALLDSYRTVSLSADPFYPSDFAPFLPMLARFSQGLSFTTNVSGNANSLNIDELRLSRNDREFNLDLNASLQHLSTPDKINAEVSSLSLYITNAFIKNIASFFPQADSYLHSWTDSPGALSLDLQGIVSMADRMAATEISVKSLPGNLNASGKIGWKDHTLLAKEISVSTDGFDISSVLPAQPIGRVSFDLSGEVSAVNGDISGSVTADVPSIEYNGLEINNIFLKANKSGNDAEATLTIDDNQAAVIADANLSIAGPNTKCSINADIAHFNPALLEGSGIKNITDIAGKLDAELNGDNIDNLRGEAVLSDLAITTPKDRFNFDRISLSATLAEGSRDYRFISPLAEAHLAGDFVPTAVVDGVKCMLHDILPTLVADGKRTDWKGQNAILELSVNPDESLWRRLNAGFMPAMPVNIHANVNGDDGTVKLNLKAPYLVKGKNKLIRNTSVALCLHKDLPFEFGLKTSFPLKHDVADLDFSASGLRDNFMGSLAWVMEANPLNKGNIDINTHIRRNQWDGLVGLTAEIRPSSFTLNGSEWSISPSTVTYQGKMLDIDNLRISNGLQYVNIDGAASDKPLDMITASLSGIDLQYIFDILDINYVDFGGIATGKAVASNIFSSEPNARTRELYVKNLAYNGCVLGNAKMEGYWDNAAKMVGINADIEASDKAAARVRGGIYVTRDSLSFDFDTRKIDIAMLKPFMAGYTSSVEGRATGHLKLYGTFADVDLGGDVFADTIAIKVDYTNVKYGGSGNVSFRPGLIDIPRMKVYDKYGNHGYFQGEVRHNFLHNPTFKFNITDARKMLVYDTKPGKENFWHGKVFANCSAVLRGDPGIVSLNIRAATTPNTEFTISLDETRSATEYTFLTFTDHSRELAVERKDSLDINALLGRNITEKKDEHPDIFSLDMSLEVNPDASLTLIMDPATGDKIKAQGNGAFQFNYDSSSDNFNIYGKYTLDKGSYNFSLQDLILKNFTIVPGSSISFIGDPMQAQLDITAAYRVNANLTELDQSFKDDPDLKRTTVPVDAMLEVSGDIRAPEINFDISLPTVTAEVDRRLRSLVSSEDMMNRQIIYLLALNRFYNAGFSGDSEHGGGELASMASSTLSAQIQNILGSITDKFTLAPSIKSEKSDLSDMEFDVALSSSLFDNRLLLNGNFGYRDRSTSQTTFIGDFDLEYLLNRRGELRLKAYNHFNDASYYLRSALTTQGIGILYRHDFNNPFGFVKKWFRRKKKDEGKTLDKNVSPSEKTLNDTTNRENQGIL